MFVDEFVREIESRYTGTTPLYFQQPQGADYPFIVILVITNNEQPNVMCEYQGEGGELSLQFSCAADSPQEALSILSGLVAVVRQIRGKIGGVSKDYRISYNATNGPQSFDAALGTWSAIAECDVHWYEVPR